MVPARPAEMTEANAEEAWELHPGVAWRVIAGEAYLVTPSRSMHRVAEPSGVWTLETLSRGPQTLDALVAGARGQFGGEHADMRGDLGRFLRQLGSNGLARRCPPPPEVAHDGREP